MGLFSVALIGSIIFVPASAQMAPPTNPFGWVDDGAVVRLTTSTDSVGIGTVSPTDKLDVIGNVGITGNLNFSGLINGLDLGAKAAQWDTAFAERRQWDGGATNLDPAAGRTSLALNSLKINDVNSLNGAVFRDTNGFGCHKLTIDSSGALNTQIVDCENGQAFTVKDDFEEYSNGTLVGDNGGTGWATPWIDIFQGNFFTVQDAVVFGGTKAVAANDPNGGFTIGRQFALKSSGIATVRVRKNNNGKTFIIQLAEGATLRCSVDFDTDDIAKLNKAGSVQDIGSFSLGDFHLINIGFDAGTNQCRASLDGGAFVSSPALHGSMSGIDGIHFDTSTGGSAGTLAYFDNVFLQ